MNRSRCSLRRLILGLSVEDAQSKFDTPESRSLLRVAHERFNQGIYHELQVAQRQRNGLAPERKCHISRFVKPSIAGFQAYVKGSPDDYIIREVWDDGDAVTADPDTAARNSTKSALTHSSASGGAVAVSSKIEQERHAFKEAKNLVLSTLSSALELVLENVVMELKDRRQSGALISKEHQSSVVDRLVGDVAEAGSKGYKTLSSSSHLLEPVEMAVTLFGRKDTAELNAFKSPILAVPAAEGDISFSLWVAGGIVASDKLMQEFPFHIAKFVAPDPKAAASTANRLPHVEVEIYFSSELFQLEKSIGQSGIHTLRQFAGRTMMRQHEPSPASSSLLLAASGDEERELYKIYDPSQQYGAVRIPWIRKVTTKVSTVTGVVFSAEDSDENPSLDRMRAAVTCVWRAWGHLIKDLHVHGDLDYLYVSINRQQECEGNEEYIAELKELEAARESNTAATNPLTETTSLARTLTSSSLAAAYVSSAGKSKDRKRYIPLPSDFVVVECTLERRGLPHNMVIEDITSTLTDMQREQLEMQRLAVLDAADAAMDVDGKKTSTMPDLDKIVPVLYEPKVVVSHSGMLENGTHSFQRIRIRGSCRAHVETLMAMLRDETNEYFTDRSFPASSTNTALESKTVSKKDANAETASKNLSFRAVRAPDGDAVGTSRRLVGHTAPSSAAVGDKAGYAVSRSLHARNQVLTLAADSSAIVSEDEREFWKENYYRLSDIKVVYHNRVDAEDALGKTMELLPPRVKQHLALVNRRLSQDQASATADGASGDAAEQNITAADKRRGKKVNKKKAKRGGKADKKQRVQAAPLNLAPEKLFEYLCTDMEAESTSYDLRVGDCAAYDYLLSLQRIPDKHLPLVTPAVTSVSTKGFINYYGPQRFATYTKMNMHPGLHLLKGEFKAAAHILVQQFYLDTALEAERQRTGQAFPRMQALQGYGGARLPDFLRHGTRRSVADHGSPLQRVLYNALQATALLSGDEEDPRAALNSFAPPLSKGLTSGLNGSGAMIDDDPCAEAFLRVIGPRACAMLIQEFLSFVWNDVVNQRFQRYGTFTLLPGDLVRPRGDFTSISGATQDSDGFAQPAYASRRDIERGVYTLYDLLLPLPGALIQLPQNHTEDLYVVALQRYGLPFDPESRQWRCFEPSRILGKSPRGKDGVGVSPYCNLTSTFSLMEEELGTRTPTTDALYRHQHDNESIQNDITAWTNADEEGSEDGHALLDAGDLRPDLRPMRGDGGNLLGLSIRASYRHPLIQPTADTMQWRLLKGALGDPYQRWGLATSAQVRATASGALLSTSRATTAAPRLSELPADAPRTLADSTWSSSPSPSLRRSMVAQLPNVESGESVEDEEGDDTKVGNTAGKRDAAAVSQGPILLERNSGTNSVAVAAATASPPVIRSPAAVKAAAAYRSPTRWRGASQIVQLQRLAKKDNRACSGVASTPTRFRRGPPAPSWLPRHQGSVLQLHLRLPAGIYPGMLLRELLKMDVSTPDIVDLDRAAGSRTDRRARAWQDLSADQQATYQQWIAKRRQQRRFVQRPRAVSLALLHQQIFRSSGIRNSLLPTLRSYDSVSK